LNYIAQKHFAYAHNIRHVVLCYVMLCYIIFQLRHVLVMLIKEVI